MEPFDENHQRHLLSFSSIALRAIYPTRDFRVVKNDKTIKLMKLLDDSCAGNEQVFRGFKDFRIEHLLSHIKPSAKRHRSDIQAWIVLWPLSAITEAFLLPFMALYARCKVRSVTLVRRAYEAIAKVMQHFADRAFSELR